MDTASEIKKIAFLGDYWLRIMPYAMSNSVTTFATPSLEEVLAAME